jgi:hypothetical protein
MGEIIIEPVDKMYLTHNKSTQITRIHIVLAKPVDKEMAKSLVYRWLSQPALLEACKATADIPDKNHINFMRKVIQAVKIAKTAIAQAEKEGERK